jgi:hypothetical protein
MKIRIQGSIGSGEGIYDLRFKDEARPGARLWRGKGGGMNG